MNGHNGSKLTSEPQDDPIVKWVWLGVFVISLASLWGLWHLVESVLTKIFSWI